MQDEPETRAPLVDLVETLTLVVGPAATFGFGLAAIDGIGSLAPGLGIGGLFGTILAGLRRGFLAFRTPDGIERRLRPVSDGPADDPWIRLASVEYDERYDPLLAVVLAALGVAAFAAIPFVDAEDWLVVRLVAVGLFGLVASLLVLGYSRMRT